MKSLLTGFVAFVFLSFGSAPVWAANEPHIIDGPWLGVQIKEERTTDAELDKIIAAGFNTVRFPLPWDYVERVRGRYEWRHFEPFIARLRAKGMRAVLILGGGNALYTPNSDTTDRNDESRHSPRPPLTKEEIDAFAQYAAAAAKFFGGDDIMWEIWNEPDTGRFWPPREDPDAYTALAGATCRAIKAVAPLARVVGPALADMPGVGERGTRFTKRFLASPDASCFDGFSLHPYRDGEVPPETVLDAYRSARRVLDKVTPRGRGKLPLLVTEWGFSLADVDGPTQAAYAARVFLLNAYARIPLTIWYEWRDAYDGRADDAEAHYGLLSRRREPKPAYVALKNLIPVLYKAAVLERLDLGREDRWAIKIRDKDGRHFVVFWTTNEEKAERVTLLGLKGTGAAREYALTIQPQLAEIGAGTLSIILIPEKAEP